MAIQAAPFIHARLNAVATSNVPGRDGGGDINIVQIIAVPRGGRLDAKSGTITIDGEVVTEPPNVEPYSGSPALELTDQSQSPPEPSPVLELETGNVTRLDSFVRRRSDDEEPDTA
jgi:hypothetical protein